MCLHSPLCTQHCYCVFKVYLQLNMSLADLIFTYTRIFFLIPLVDSSTGNFHIQSKSQRNYFFALLASKPIIMKPGITLPKDPVNPPLLSSLSPIVLTLTPYQPLLDHSNLPTVLPASNLFHEIHLSGVHQFMLSLARRAETQMSSFGQAL